MVNEEQIDQLEAEITLLKRQRDAYKGIKALKLERLGNQIQNVPEKFGAKHPVLAFLAEQGYRGAKGAANLAGQGAGAYYNFVKAEQEREARLKQEYPRAFQKPRVKIIVKKIRVPVTKKIKAKRKRSTKQANVGYVFEPGYGLVPIRNRG